MKIDIAVIPGGCTSLIQAPDVSWNKPFKAALCELYDNWLQENNQEVTKPGNVKAATPDVICNWIVEAWNKLPDELIAKFFCACALGLALDGTDDHEIHCFKPHGACPLKPEELKEKLQHSNEEFVENIDLVEDESDYEQEY